LSEQPLYKMCKRTHKTISSSSSFVCGRRPNTTWQTCEKNTSSI